MFSRLPITLFALLGFALMPAFLVSFSEKPDNQHMAHQRASLLSDKAAALYITAKAFSMGQSDLEQLEKALRNTRQAYKEIEFLIVHFYPEFAESHLNGAPLWHIERAGSRANVLPPEGLQYLDELVHADDPQSESMEIIHTAKAFENEYNLVLQDFKKRKITDSELITAMRRQLISIFTLGVTGFDTPGSASGIEESRASLQALFTFVKNYPFSENTLLQEKLYERFEQSINYLDQNKDFHTFDRLVFLKEFINPLYAALKELQDLFPNKNASQYSAWNENSENIFDTDFLDPYFYTELKADEDSPALRKLGETLFYDVSLSASGNMSCGSCHNPRLAFTDGRKKSESNINSETVERNAPTLLNAVYADRYFYDLRAFSLEQQAEHVIFNHQEFNTAYTEIIDKIKDKPAYKSQFVELFHTDHPERAQISQALTSFVLSLQSFNSPFDKYVRGESRDLPAEVKEGFNLFMGKAACGTCHFAPTFAGLVPPYFQKSESEILGVLSHPGDTVPILDGDMGRLANGIINEEAWIYKKSFKTMSVRNVAMTAPYFHNGAYGSLKEVMDFYNHGGGAGLGLEVENQTLAGDPLDLSDAEMNAIIAFMEALTDNSTGVSRGGSIFPLDN